MSGSGDMHQMFVVIVKTPHGDGFDIAGAFQSYGAANAEAHSIGLDQCWVRAVKFTPANYVVDREPPR